MLRALLCLSLLSMCATGAFADYTAIYNCNNGAAVLDEYYRDMGMRGGVLRHYQFVIRDKGIIDYLISTQAFSVLSLYRDGSELIVRFHNQIQARISETSMLEDFLEEDRDLNSIYKYKLILDGRSIKLQGVGPLGQEADWYFGNCEAIGEDK